MPFLFILVGIVAYIILTYNKFQSTKTNLEASIQEIGNQLKRQINLIPNLESSVKGYLKHEKGIFKDLTDARKQISSAKTPNQMSQAADKMSSVLPNIQIAIEDNPELKADKTVTRLMDELRDTQDKVMYSRRTLIDLTADYNRMVITVPSNVVAQIFKFKKQPGLATPTTGAHVQVSASDTKSPKIKI